MGGKAIALGLAAAILSAHPAWARGREAAFIELGARTEPPRGFTEMCASDSSLCRSFAPALVAPSPQASAIFRGVIMSTGVGDLARSAALDLPQWVPAYHSPTPAAALFLPSMSPPPKAATLCADWLDMAVAGLGWRLQPLQRGWYRRK